MGPRRVFTFRVMLKMIVAVLGRFRNVLVFLVVSFACMPTRCRCQLVPTISAGTGSLKSVTDAPRASGAEISTFITGK